MKHKPISEYLETAADRLEKDGIARGAWQRKENACTAKTVTNVIFEDPQVRGASYKDKLGLVERALRFIHRAAGLKRDIPTWNDNSQTTDQEILDGVRKGAKLARINEEGLEDFR